MKMTIDFLIVTAIVMIPAWFIAGLLLWIDDNYKYWWFNFKAFLHEILSGLRRL